jgi:hypothetical protein
MWKQTSFYLTLLSRQVGYWEVLSMKANILVVDDKRYAVFTPTDPNSEWLRSGSGQDGLEALWFWRNA